MSESAESTNITLYSRANCPMNRPVLQVLLAAQARIDYVDIAEDDAARQLVECWRHHHAVAARAREYGAQVIGADEKHVRSLGCADRHQVPPVGNGAFGCPFRAK